MAGEIVYFPDESTALMTPDALAVMLRQAGLRCALERQDEDPNEVDIILDADQTRLLLAVNDGFVTGLEVDVTFVDEQAKSPRVCEMLESLGWLREE